MANNCIRRTGDVSASLGCIAPELAAGELLQTITKGDVRVTQVSTDCHDDDDKIVALAVARHRRCGNRCCVIGDAGRTGEWLRSVARRGRQISSHIAG